MAVQHVFLLEIMDQITGFGKVINLDMLQHLLRSYRAINKIVLEENAMKIIGAYDPLEHLSHLIKQLEKGW